MIYIAPSILSANLLKLESQVQEAENAGADYIHVDIMDGHFVPNITFGPTMVKALKSITKLPLDVHLMISEPDKYIAEFIKAGSDIVTVHQETCPHLHRTVQFIKNEGAQAGVTINPATPVDLLLPVLSEVDLVLIMSVNPGFGGQKFIQASTGKIKYLSDLKKKHDYRFLVEVDGGISVETAPAVAKAGAEILVAGSAIFNQPDITAALKSIRDSVQNYA